jgi:hypothetical protein
MAFDVSGRGQSCGARMTHIDNQGPISNQAVNLYFSGGAYLSVRMKISQSGSPGLNFGDIAAVYPGRREDVSHGSNLGLRLGNAS